MTSAHDCCASVCRGSSRAQHVPGMHFSGCACRAHALHCMPAWQCVTRGTALIPPGCRMRGLLASALSTRDASTQCGAAALPSVVSSSVQTALVPADAQAGLRGTRQSQAGGELVHKVLFPVACTPLSLGTFAALCRQAGLGALCLLWGRHVHACFCADSRRVRRSVSEWSQILSPAQAEQAAGPEVAAGHSDSPAHPQADRWQRAAAVMLHTPAGALELVVLCIARPWAGATLLQTQPWGLRAEVQACRVVSRTCCTVQCCMRCPRCTCLLPACCSTSSGLSLQMVRR